MEYIGEYTIPSNYNPSNKTGYWSLDCPRCGAKGRAFWYEGCPSVRCNREGSCGYEDNIWNLPGISERRNFKRFIDNDYQAHKEKPDPRDLDKTDLIEPALGKCTGDPKIYLEIRLPGIDVQKRLIDRKIVGSTYHIQGLRSMGKRYFDQGFRLFCPLYNIRKGFIVSGQARFFGYGVEPPVMDNGKELRLKSFARCTYGNGGATFGRMSDALKVAEELAEKSDKAPYLIVAEGLMDYLTFRACGYDNVVGVPGVSQAKNVANYLLEKGWKGMLLLSLDGDDAGEESVQIVERILKKSENIIVFNLRHDEMLVDVKDINDIFNKWGGESAIHRSVNFATARTVKKKNFNDLVSDELFQSLARRGLWAKAPPTPIMSKDVARMIIKATGAEKSPVSKLGRVVLCKEIKQAHMLYEDVQKSGTIVGLQNRVAESNYCSHCLTIQWNLYIAKYLQDKWSPQLSMLSLEFDTLEEGLKIKKDLAKDSRPPRALKADKDKTFGNNIFVIMDFIKNRVVAAFDNNRDDDYCASVIRAYGKTEIIKRERFLKEYVMPAFFSSGYHFNRIAENKEIDITKDPILSTKMKRFFSRAGMPWPKTEEIRQGVRNYCKKSRGEGQSREELPNGTSVFVTFREREGVFRKMNAVSLQPMNFKNIMNADLFDKKMSYNPKQPDSCNLMDHPERSPVSLKRVFEDFFWQQYGKPPYVLDFEFQVPMDSKIISQMDEKEQSAEYARWIDHGYDPEKYTFAFGSKGFETFEKFMQFKKKEEAGNPYVKQFIKEQPKKEVFIPDEEDWFYAHYEMSREEAIEKGIFKEPEYDDDEFVLDDCYMLREEDGWST